MVNVIVYLFMVVFAVIGFTLLYKGYESDGLFFLGLFGCASILQVDL